MSPRVTVVVDRVEAYYAVLSWNDRTFDFPLELLPEGVKEGWVLTPEWKRDEAAEAEKRAELAGRMGKLVKDDDGGDFSL